MSDLSHVRIDAGQGPHSAGVDAAHRRLRKPCDERGSDARALARIAVRYWGSEAAELLSEALEVVHEFDRR